MSETVELDTKKLDQLIKAFKVIPEGKIGVLGSKNGRKDDGSNATIGAKHEFGQDGMPQRSFLRMPLTENLGEYLENSGTFNEEVLKQVIKEGSIVKWVKEIMIVCEHVVADAFETSGFGKWKLSNMKYKKNHQTLVETQQLRNSITSEVK